MRLLWNLLLELGRLSLAERRWPDDRLFLQAAYRAFLKRDPDEIGRVYYLRELQRKALSRSGLLRSITQSSEFRQFHGLRVHPLHAMHQARMQLVQQCLPPAQTILDLGGAAVDHAAGALLMMGYPHRPREIVIVDLPPDQRLHDGRGAEASRQVTTADGIFVRYLYSSMADLSAIESGWADLVWSGESIEHISEAEADQVCQEAFRVLKPGGYFCLDTPNAALTRIQSPDKFIHPEHQKEYYVPELRDKLQRWGFSIIEQKAIIPMPQSLQRGVFDHSELVANIGLGDDPELGYMFYLKAMKPHP
jgi:SAM-dependent methyltransferase